MSQKIDARGMACPLPVVNTKEALAHMQPGEMLEVWVDNEIAVQNLAKFARIRGHAMTSERKEEREFRVRITKGRQESPVQEEKEELPSCEPCARGSLVVIASAQMGQGEEPLGRTLMKAFLFALTRLDTPPKTVLLYNSGAFLSCEGSDSVEDLRVLQEKGAEILTCGTCLNYYGLTEKLAVGGVTNMYDIVERMEQAEKILRP